MLRKQVQVIKAGDGEFMIIGGDPHEVKTILDDTLYNKDGKAWRAQKLLTKMLMMNNLYMQLRELLDDVAILSSKQKEFLNSISPEVDDFRILKAQHHNITNSLERKIVREEVEVNCPYFKTTPADIERLNSHKESLKSEKELFKSKTTEEIQLKFIEWSKEKSRYSSEVNKLKNKIRKLINLMNQHSDLEVYAPLIREAREEIEPIYEPYAIREAYSLCNLSKTRRRHHDEIRRLNEFLSGSLAMIATMQKVSKSVYEKSQWVTEDDYQHDLLFLNNEKFIKNLEANGFKVFHTAKDKFVIDVEN